MDSEKIIAALEFGPDTDKTLAYTEWLADMVGTQGSVRHLHVMDYALSHAADIFAALYRTGRDAEPGPA